MKGWKWSVGLGALLLLPVGSEAQLVLVSDPVQEMEAAPGEVYEGRIQLRNPGSEAVSVRVYQTDYLFYADGRTLYPDAGSDARSNADWMRVTPPAAVVPAGAMIEIAYTVAVPRADALSGTYWSMVMVEPVREDGASVSAEQGIGLSTVVRFGVQVATHVGGDTEHRLDIVDARVTSDEAGRRLAFSLVNSGRTGYRPLVSLELYDATGSVVATRTDQRGLLYPGTSTLQDFDLAGLAEGAYRALIIVDTGAPEVFGAQFDVTLGPPR